MRIVAVVPVGPGHEQVAVECERSLRHAWEYSRRPFGSFTVSRRFDTLGKLGRSKARNLVVADHPEADWFFFIDADDLCRGDAFELFYDRMPDPELIAVFGAVYTDRNRKIDENVYPLDWDGLIRHKARGTLSMGCFVRGDVARATPFDETLDQAEDFDFYLRALHGRKWIKLATPLVTIRLLVPAARGPRGLGPIGWREACGAVVDQWQKKEACQSIPV